MLNRNHAAIKMARAISLYRWGAYFDLLCVASFGMSLRRAIAALSPALTSAKDATSDRCVVRGLMMLFVGLFVTGASAASQSPCATRRVA